MIAAVDPSGSLSRRLGRGYGEAMAGNRIVTIEDLEMLSPVERRKLHDERLVTDLSEVDQALLERAKTDVKRALDQRRVLEPE